MVTNYNDKVRWPRPVWPDTFHSKRTNQSLLSMSKEFRFAFKTNYKPYLINTDPLNYSCFVLLAALVSDSHLINVAQPFADVFEALGVSDVIDQHDAHSASVVRGGDGVEPFLACCVPTQQKFHLEMLNLSSNKSR